MKVLWLASWYPTNNNSLNGDFIKRHAEAVSLFTPVTAIHVERVNKRSLHQKTKKKDEHSPNLTSIIHGYYLPYFFSLDKIYSYFLLFSLYVKYVKKYIDEHGKPDIIHAHISLRCSLVAWYCKKRFKIPYIISEQSSAFLPLAKKFNNSIGAVDQYYLKKAFQHASAVTTVSDFLGKAIQQNFSSKKFYTVFNVVNTDIFFPSNQTIKNTKPVFLHISTLMDVKNPFAIIEAFNILKTKFKQEFILKIVGPDRKDLKEYINSLQLQSSIEWMPEKTQPELSELLNTSDAHIIYSVYETFCCVNIEAMACGVPTIVSDIPTFREYLIENVTSHFAESNNPEALAKVLNNFILASNFSRETIAQHAQNFSYQIIGKQFFNIYQEVLQ